MFSFDKTNFIIKFKKYLLSTYYAEVTMVDAMGIQIYGSYLHTI